MRPLKQMTTSLYGKFLILFLLGIFTISCEKEELNSTNLETADASVKSMNTVKITSTGMNFDAPDEIPQGWTTFSYKNKTSELHFFILVKIPDDKTLEEYHQEVTVPFNNYLKFLRGEEIEPEEMAIAGWFFTEAYNTGGSGLIDPGKTAVSSVNLEPGNYIIECYVKLPNGDFHSLVGMLDQMTVTNEVSTSKEPKADVSIRIDGNGLNLEDEIKRPGLHTFSVDFAAGSTADVHLVKIENPDNANRELLKNWIYWGNNIGQTNEGLMTPAPEGFSFIGGTQEFFDSENDKRTYFQAVLKPGTYALVSEVPYNIIDEHYIEFTVE